MKSLKVFKHHVIPPVAGDNVYAWSYRIFRFR